MEALKVKNLTASYPSGFTLLPMSFEIPKGSFTGVIGPNGSGKSTLFKSLSGTLTCQSHETTLYGKDLRKLSNRDRARSVAVVSQKIEVESITVDDFVMMGRLPHQSKYGLTTSKRDWEIASKYIQLVGIEHLRHHQLDRLSGGEQQLAAIAAALTQEPELLLLDEPTAHLDIMHQVQVMNMIKHLNKELGLTVMIVIHDLNLGSEYCDNLLLIKSGELKVSGTPKDVLTYQNIEKYYETVVVISDNPITHKPNVMLIPEHIIIENQQKHSS